MGSRLRPAAPGRAIFVRLDFSKSIFSQLLTRGVGARAHVEHANVCKLKGPTGGPPH